MEISWVSCLLVLLFGLATFAAASTMGLFGGNQMPVDGKVMLPNVFSRVCLMLISQTVLITGASEGMGLSVAKQLAAKGANVIIVARSVGKLEAAVESITVCCPPSSPFQVPQG